MAVQDQVESVLAQCLQQVAAVLDGVITCPFTGLERLRLGGLSDTP